MSEWIKCKERLPDRESGDPECSENVLVFQVYWGSQMLQAFYSHTDELWYDQKGDQVDGSITHWMPLPSPPEDSQ